VAVISVPDELHALIRDACAGQGRTAGQFLAFLLARSGLVDEATAARLRDWSRPGRRPLQLPGVEVASAVSYVSTGRG
jgi:hypothetical protein